MKDGGRTTAAAAPAPLPPTLIVCASGRRRGKTAWAEALVRALGARGARVGVVKHHPHPAPPHAPEPDPPALPAPPAPPRIPDTQRAIAAGARASVLATPHGLAVEGLDPAGPDAELDRALRALQAAAPEVDVVIAEGFRHSLRRPRLWLGDGDPPPSPAPCRRAGGTEADCPAAVAAVVAWMVELGLLGDATATRPDL